MLGRKRLETKKVNPCQVLTDDGNAFCNGKVHDIFTMKDGEKVPIDSRWTALLHKENGEWKIASLHAGANFKDNAVLTRGEDEAKSALQVGFAAGVVMTIGCRGIFFSRKMENC